jgi:hypothetical protein
LKDNKISELDRFLVAFYAIIFIWISIGVASAINHYSKENLQSTAQNDDGNSDWVNVGKGSYPRYRSGP